MKAGLALPQRLFDADLEPPLPCLQVRNSARCGERPLPSGSAARVMRGASPPPGVRAGWVVLLTMRLSSLHGRLWSAPAPTSYLWAEPEEKGHEWVYGRQHLARPEPLLLR